MTISAGLVLNEQPLVSRSKVHTFFFRESSAAEFGAALNDQPIWSVVFDGLRSTSAEAVNEVMNLALLFDFKGTGIKKLVLQNLPPLFALPAATIERTANAAQFITHFEITEMCGLMGNSAAMSSLTDLAVMIFEQTETLVHVNMYNSSISVEGGTRIIESLSGSSIAKLTYVNMG